MLPRSGLSLEAGEGDAIPMDTDNHPSIQAGDWVEIDGLLRVGRVLRLDPRQRIAEVNIAGVVWRIAVRRLRRSATAEERGERIARENLPPPISLPAIPTSDVLDLHGLTVEDGMEQLDKFVDSAVVNRLQTIKIIHGHGSGRLRNAVSQYLKAHPAIRRFQFGAPWEGGFAVTIAYLDVD